MTEVLLAVNGGLMSGLRSNHLMVQAGARFVRNATTAPRYRLWSIGDRHPAMVQVSSDGASIALEVWALPSDGFVAVLAGEPPGLSVGKVELDDGEVVHGVIGEPVLCEGQADITTFGGWRAYLESRS